MLSVAVLRVHQALLQLPFHSRSHPSPNARAALPVSPHNKSDQLGGNWELAGNWKYCSISKRALNIVMVASDNNSPEWPFSQFTVGMVSCSFLMEISGLPSGSTAFMQTKSTYILRLVLPAQSSDGYGSETNCPQNTIPALLSPSRNI